MRQIQRRPKTKREVLTLGGRGDYVIAENELNDLVRIFAKTTDYKQTRKLLFSLFTNRELADVVRRIEIAKLITHGDSYDKIVAKANTARITISLIRKVLRHNPDLVTMLNPESNLKNFTEGKFINRVRKGK